MTSFDLHQRVLGMLFYKSSNLYNQLARSYARKIFPDPGMINEPSKSYPNIELYVTSMEDVEVIRQLHANEEHLNELFTKAWGKRANLVFGVEEID